MFSFIHAADIHLDSPLRGLEAREEAPVEEIRGATRLAFENLVDLSLSENVDFVLIAGDLYDGDWKDYNTGLFFVKQMGRLDRAGIRVFIVSGNHDAANQITKTMPLPGNVTLFSHKSPQSIVLEDLGAAIHGQSYASRSITENLAVQYPMYKPGYFNIGLLHTSLTGREGHETYAPCTLDDLKTRGYDYWALGHVHKREVVCRDPMVVFPGNIQGRHIKETGPKGVALINVTDDRAAEITWHDINVLPWTVCEADLSECETTVSVYDAVRQALEQALDTAPGGRVAVRLYLTGQSPVHEALHDRRVAWSSECRGIAAGIGGIWLEKVEIRTSRMLDIEDVVGRDTPIAGLIASIENLEINNDSLLTLIPDLAVLKSKLPPEIHGMDEPFPCVSDEASDLLRREVQELLIARLIVHGGNQ